MKKILALVVSALCTAGLISTFAITPAQAAPWQPRDDVIFNNIKGSASAENAIIIRLNAAISRAPRGSVISMAMYLFDRAPMARALVRAHRRGVHVQMIIDDGERSGEAAYLRKYLRERRPGYSRHSFVMSCKRSCMSNVAGSVLHSKFYIFSRVGARRYVSMISSANPHNVNTKASWNNIHTIVNNKRIYDSLRGYFLDMRKDQSNLDYWMKRRPVTSGKYTVSYYPRKPRRGVQTVEFMNALRGVKCRTAGGYGSGGRTVIRVAMWGWTNPLIAVAKRLRSLKSQGCKVDVILNQGRASRSIIRELIRPTKSGQIPVYNAWRDRNRNDYGEMYVHHKALIINGRWYGRRDAKVVYTGSQNLTSTGVSVNDDQVLRVVDATTYNRYSANFSYIAGRWAPRMRKMPKRIILKSSPHGATVRGKFGTTTVDTSDGISKAEGKILDAQQDAVTEAGIDR